MALTIGLVANVYNEANALPGWLETHLPFFDDVRVLHAGPNGELSTDGTLDLLSKWHIPVKFSDIAKGFGVVRTEAVRFSPCDWVMLLDIDERFFAAHRILICSGESTPHSEVDAILQTYDFRDIKTLLPNWENVSRLGAKLQVDAGRVYDQMAQLHSIIDGGEYDAVATVRRHWHDLSLRRPTQNWHTDPDWQRRLVRNQAGICFAPEIRMHEQLIGAERIYRADTTYGPFFDHFHFTFKKMEIAQRSHDVAIYNAIHEECRPPTWEEFNRPYKAT